MRSQLWLLAASGHLASADSLFGQAPDARGAVGSSWPRATGASAHDGAKGWTPKPTEAPYVVGGANALELARRRDQLVRQKRQQTTANTWVNAQTCGWRAGTKPVPFTCGASYSCATNSDNVVGCNSADTPDPFFTVCLDYKAYNDGLCASVGPKTGCCQTESIGSCITYLWAGPTPRSMYLCSTAQTVITMLDEPQFSQTTSSSPTSSSTSASTTSSTSSSTASSLAAESTTGTPAPVSSGSSNNTGAIVGGVVGGVAGIALIAGAIAWLVIRNRIKNRTVGAGTAYSAVAPGDTSYPGSGGATLSGGPMPPSTYASSSVSQHMSHAGYFPPNNGGLRPETPYLAGGTPPAQGPYNPHTPYYDPVKLAEHQQQYGLYAGQQQYPAAPHSVVLELDPGSMAAGHQSNPAEMAANPAAER